MAEGAPATKVNLWSIPAWRDFDAASIPRDGRYSTVNRSRPIGPQRLANSRDAGIVDIDLSLAQSLICA